MSEGGAGYLYLYDYDAAAWVKARGDADGKMVVDPSNIIEELRRSPAAPERIASSPEGE